MPEELYHPVDPRAAPEIIEIGDRAERTIGYCGGVKIIVSAPTVKAMRDAGYPAEFAQTMLELHLGLLP